MTTVTAERLEHLMRPPPPDPAVPDTWLVQPMEDLQRAAATAAEGPLMIIGGAGTGKSRTLENRAIHLVKAGASPSNIAIITFNARAAQRLRREMSHSTGADPTAIGYFVGTLHRYCSNLLRHAGWKVVGINPGFTICDQEQSITILEDLIARDHPDQPPQYPRTQLFHVLRWFDLNRSRDPEDETSPRDPVWNEYIDRYQTEKRRQQLLDFTDLLVLAKEALEHDRALRQTYANIRSRHLIIDEFQDLTPLQYQLIRLMTGPTKSVTVALDPNQSIYGWRGADPSLYKRFMFDYNNPTLCGLSVNHRTTARIMRGWRAMVANPLMTGLSDDAQTGLRPGDRRPEEHCVEGPIHSQYAAIADHMRRIIDQEGYRPDQIAVLSRRKSSVQRMANQLDLHSIPYWQLGEAPGNQDANVECVNAMLSLTVNPSNSWAFRKAADCDVTRSSNRNLNHVINRDIQTVARDQDLNLIDAARAVRDKMANPEHVIPRQLTYVIETWTELQEMLDQAETDTANLIRHVHDRMYRHGAGHPSQQLAPPVNRILTIAERSDRSNPRLSPRQRVTAYLEAQANALNPDEQSEENDDPFHTRQAVALATVYASKGLQWPVVFFADCSAQIVPGEMVRENTPRMDEEQRLFYVAVTRAEEQLHFYWGRQDESGSEAAPSPFIETMMV